MESLNIVAESRTIKEQHIDVTISSHQIDQECDAVVIRVFAGMDKARILRIPMHVFHETWGMTNDRKRKSKWSGHPVDQV